MLYFSKLKIISISLVSLFFIFIASSNIFNFSNKILKKKENDIESKKNILSKEELNIQIESLKKQIIDFRKEKASMVKEFNLFKKKQISNLMKSINPIIAEYVKEKSINIVLDKKNILIGKTNYDITKDILVLVDNKIK